MYVCKYGIIFYLIAFIVCITCVMCIMFVCVARAYVCDEKGGLGGEG